MSTNFEVAIREKLEGLIDDVSIRAWVNPAEGECPCDAKLTLPPIEINFLSIELADSDDPYKLWQLFKARTVYELFELFRKKYPDKCFMEPNVKTTPEN